MPRETRRAFSTSTGLATALVAGSTVPSTLDGAAAQTGSANAETGADWPTFHGTAGRTGFAPTPGPTEGPFVHSHLLDSTAVDTTLAVSGGQIYADVELDGTAAGVALDAASGAQSWRVTDSFGGLAGAADGLVFGAGTDDAFREAELVARSAADGSVQWRTGIERGVSDVGVATGDGVVYVPNNGFGGLPRGVDAVYLSTTDSPSRSTRATGQCAITTRPSPTSAGSPRCRTSLRRRRGGLPDGDRSPLTPRLPVEPLRNRFA